MDKRLNSVFNDNIDTQKVIFKNINDSNSSLMNKRQNSIKLKLCRIFKNWHRRKQKKKNSSQKN